MGGRFGRRCDGGLTNVRDLMMHFRGSFGSEMESPVPRPRDCFHRIMASSSWSIAWWVSMGINNQTWVNVEHRVVGVIQRERNSVEHQNIFVEVISEPVGIARR